MKSLQEYRNEYRKIAQNLGYHGDGVELLIQLLSNATYIEEVENISYMEESSLEKAHLENSKIQHCMDLMYSVYRGSCPRVYIKFKAKTTKVLSRYSEIATSSNFNVYFLGALGENMKDEEDKKYIETAEGVTGFNLGFNFDSDVTLLPREEPYIICGFISKAPKKISSQISYTNPYYIDLDGSGISHDILVSVEKQGSGSVLDYKTTTNFKEYLLQSPEEDETGELNHYIFDLTTPDFGSRLYFKDSYGIEATDIINVSYFPFSRTSDFLASELSKISINFGTLVDFEPEFLQRGECEVSEKGLIVIKESEPENLLGIHYNAVKSRYQNSVVRSNYDMGDLLRLAYINKVSEATCVFGEDGIIIYYIPGTSDRLDEDDVNRFISNYQAYYIAKNITIAEAKAENLVLDISVVLTSANSELEDKIKDKVAKYSRSFAQAYKIIHNEEEIINRLRAEISKIPGVSYVSAIEFINKSEDEEGQDKARYFNISCVINSRLE